MNPPDPIVEIHHRAPSAIAFTARAIRPSPGLRPGAPFPALVQRWEGLRIEARQREELSRLTGIADAAGLALLVPHVVGFPLVMAMLTHRAYPLPIWNALQIRNHVALEDRLECGEAHDLETRVVAHRPVEKGVEVDLATVLTRAARPVWRSAITFFYRGRFGEPAGEEAPQAPELGAAPEEASFVMPRAGGLAMARMTGDYNPLHYWGWYARRMRFASRFLHPQRTVGLCMSRLRAPASERQFLDLWIKGPVFYGAPVTLRSQARESSVAFGLALDGDPRQALRGEWGAAT